MITGSKVRLRPKKLADALDDYTWQTDPELAQLDATPPSTVTFPQYLSDYAGVLKFPSPAKHEFAIETLDGKHIGHCAYYAIDQDKGEAELGIMIGNRDYWDKGYGSDAVATLISYIFRKTNLKRTYLKTLDLNTRAQKCFKKCGFVAYGRRIRDGKSFILMELHRSNWQDQQRKNLKKTSREVLSKQ